MTLSWLDEALLGLVLGVAGVQLLCWLGAELPRRLRRALRRR